MKRSRQRGRRRRRNRLNQSGVGEIIFKELYVSRNIDTMGNRILAPVTLSTRTISKKNARGGSWFQLISCIGSKPWKTTAPKGLKRHVIRSSMIQFLKRNIKLDRSLGKRLIRYKAVVIASNQNLIGRFAC